MQLSPLTSPSPSQASVGLGIQGPGLSVISPTPQQQNPVQQSSQHIFLPVASKDSGFNIRTCDIVYLNQCILSVYVILLIVIHYLCAESDPMKVEEQQQQHQTILDDDSNADSSLNSGLKPSSTNEDDLKPTHTVNANAILFFLRLHVHENVYLVVSIPIFSTRNA